MTDKEIQRILVSNNIGADLHCHFEGILTLEDLKKVAYSIDSSGLLNKDTWNFIESTIKNDEMSLQNFFSRLSGRWIRLMCIAAYTKYEMEPAYTLSRFAEHALEKMWSQGIRVLEVMVSVHTFSSSGDFGSVPIPDKTCSEERSLLREWNNSSRVEAAKISTSMLFNIFHDAIKNGARFQSSSQPMSPGVMSVGVKYMIRREKDASYRNNSQNVELLANNIVDLYSTGRIVGVDIAGDEYSPDGAMRNFRTFFQKLSIHHIPFTAHAGEVSFDSPQRDQSYENLELSVELGAKRLGHAVRLFDDNNRMNELLKKVLELENVFIEVNLTSNIWTGAVSKKDLSTHPIILALNGNHSLFSNRGALVEKLLSSLVICDDNPAIVEVHARAHSIPHEIATVLRLLVDNYTREGFIYNNFINATKATLRSK